MTAISNGAKEGGNATLAAAKPPSPNNSRRVSLARLFAISISPSLYAPWMVFLCFDAASAKLQCTTNHYPLPTRKRRGCDVKLMLARLRIPEGSINLPSSAPSLTPPHQRQRQG